LKKSDKRTPLSEKQNFKCEAPRTQAGASGGTQWQAESEQKNNVLIVPLNPTVKAGLGSFAGQNLKAKSVSKVLIQKLSLWSFAFRILFEL